MEASGAHLRHTRCAGGLRTIEADRINRLEVSTVPKSFDWSSFAENRRSTMMWLVSFPFVTILVPVLLRDLLPWRVVGLLCFAVCAIQYSRAGGRYAALSCPNCGGRFFESAIPIYRFEALGVLSANATCRHCGVQLGAQPSHRGDDTREQ